MKPLAATAIIFLIHGARQGLEAQTVAETCGSELAHRHLYQTNAAYRSDFDAFRASVRQKAGARQAAGSTTVYIVPLVVHVIHLGEAEGSGSNISDAQIIDAIQGLNNRWSNISGFSQDMDVDFCLAVRDPGGSATDGINRINGSGVPNYAADGIEVDGTGGADEEAVKSLSIWPRDQYYNIWVVSNIYGPVSGYAYFPTTYTYEGTVIDYHYMTSASGTLAHELGHAFGLFHTHEGDNDGTSCPPNTDCTVDGDEMCDTPPHRRGDCGSSNPCTTSGIWDNSRYNYMSYCSGNRFTPHQKTRVQSEAGSFPRSSFITSQGCVRVTCANGEICSDNDLCTADQCISALCAYTPLNCDDGNICTTDECMNGVCTHSTDASALSTGFSGSRTHNGNMFDVTAVHAVTVLSFDCNFNNTSSFSIYYRAGSHVGYEQNAAAWTLLGSTANLPSNGRGTATPIPIPVGITIPAGQTFSFYITITSSAFVNYTLGTAVGAVAAQNASLIIREGTANAYPFGTVFSPRKWNGILHYAPAGCLADCDPCDDGNVCTADNCMNGQCAFPDTCCRTQNISLSSGWNMISGYIIPDIPTMPSVFERIVSSIILVKNNAGQTYIPSLNINSIGNWDYRQGYKVKTSASTTLTLSCTQANPSTPIVLDAGWNLTPYLRTTAMSITAALASLGSNIIMVKNNAGQTYIPSSGINTIGNMLPGQGYQIKLSAPATLVYPP